MSPLHRRWVQGVAAAVLGLSLAACALNDEIDSQVDRLERNVEGARSAGILKNIVRASEDKPLDFTTVPSLHGTNSITSTLGLPAVVFGPAGGLPLSNPSRYPILGGGMQGSGAANTIGATGTTTFDMSALESRDFYNGLLNPLPPETMALFQAQDVPREILFYLFVDQLATKDRDGDHLYRNDPADAAGFAQFRGLVDLAVRYGLTFEVISPNKAHRERPGDGACDKDDKDGGTCGRKPERPAVALCFDPKLAEEPESAVIKAVRPICGQPHVAGSGREVAVYQSSHGPVQISGRPRSIFGLFQYLGRIVALGDRGLIQLRSGASNSTRIIGILTQLVALATSISDIPFTPTVHITN